MGNMIKENNYIKKINFLINYRHLIDFLIQVERFLQIISLNPYFYHYLSFINFYLYRFILRYFYVFSQAKEHFIRSFTNIFN